MSNGIMKAPTNHMEQTFRTLPLLLPTREPSRCRPGFFARLYRALDDKIPFGYQDGTGFHYGVEHTPGEIVIH
jgi:hypothetical protein